MQLMVLPASWHRGLWLRTAGLVHLGFTAIAGISGVELEATAPPAQWFVWTIPVKTSSSSFLPAACA